MVRSTAERQNERRRSNRKHNCLSRLTSRVLHIKSFSRCHFLKEQGASVVLHLTHMGTQVACVLWS